MNITNDLLTLVVDTPKQEPAMSYAVSHSQKLDEIITTTGLFVKGPAPQYDDIITLKYRLR
ncbi:hypothetical protein HZB07_01445 [Candidatus Saganbacteria bacterium]|nr:hypothetical protein [Candidatus Saganbacteria bacterium]